MATYRVIKDKDNPYIMMNKFCVFDSRLSWKAKGILMYFLSRPDSWEFNEVEIRKHAKDGRDATRSGINELVEKKYIRRVKDRSQNGKFSGWVYEVYEVPKEECEEGKTKPKPRTENTKSVKSISEKLTSGNPPLINNEFNNNDFINIDLNNKRNVEEGNYGDGTGAHGDHRENKEEDSEKSRETEWGYEEDDII